MDLVDGLFPAGRIHLLGGAAGTGKTTLLSWMLRKIKAGEEVFGRATTPPPGGIHFIAADHRWEEYTEILQPVGLEVDSYYSFADDPEMSYKRFSSPDPVPLLKQALYQRVNPPKGAVVVVDVLGLFMGDDLRKYRQLVGYLWEYTRWVKELDITLFGLVHAGKQKGAEAERYVRLFDRVMGGGPMRAASSTACYLTSREELGKDSKVQLLEILPRRGEPMLVEVAWNEAGLLLPVSELFTVQLEDNEQGVLGLIPEDSGVSAEELVELADGTFGIGRTTTYKCLQKLRQAGLVAKQGHGKRDKWVRLRLN